MNKTIKYKTLLLVLFISFVVIIAAIFISDMPAAAAWKEDENGRRYISDEGENAIGFEEIDGYKYYFDDEGYMKTGKIYIESDDAYYYADEKGIIQIGVIDDEDRFYITDDNGKIRVGFVEYDGKTYYFNKRAEQLFGWFMLDDDWYYADDSGEIRTGFVTVDGYRYYLDRDGKRVSDTVMEIDGVTYIFSADGSVDEDATTLYPVYSYIYKGRTALSLDDILMDNKLQACAKLRAEALVSGFTDDSENIVETMIKNRGIKSLGGYEFAYGGIDAYEINSILTDMERDDRFRSAFVL